MEKKLLWPGEVGRELGLSAATIRRFADQGMVKSFRDYKNRRRFRADAVEILRRKLRLKK